MIRNFILAGAASAALAVPAMAQEVEISGNVALTTDYVWRGATQSMGDFAVQGGFDLAAGNFYAGTWASSVEYGDDASTELDLYAGYAGAFESGLSYDVGVIGYYFPDASGYDDVYEIYGGLGYAFPAGVEIGGYLWYDPDGENLWAEATAAYAFTDMFGVDASVGNYSFDEGEDYTAFSVGLGVATPVGLDLDLRLWDTDVDGDEERFVLTVSKSL